MKIEGSKILVTGGCGLIGSTTIDQVLAENPAKVVIYDMGGVPQVWRIASFLLLGLTMIGIAAGYSKVANRLRPTQHPL